jgi:hypothetical protein
MNHALSLASRVRIPKSIASHELHGEMLVLNPTTGACVSLDPVGTKIWKLLLEHHSLQTVLHALVQEYDVTEAQGGPDLLRFAASLVEKGFAEVRTEKTR